MGEFLTSFSPGDKVYGLAGPGIGRNRYVSTPEFMAVYGNLDITTDQLNNRFLGTGVRPDGASLYFSNAMRGVQMEGMTAEQTEETDRFRTFLETHPKKKYRPEQVWTKPERNLRVARACKAALEFNVMLMGRRIHFILDDIDLYDVMDKKLTRAGNKSITGQELRFLYRSEVITDFKSENFSRQSRRPTATANTGETSRAPVKVIQMPLHPWTIQSSLSVEKTNRILGNVWFWCEGTRVASPWHSGIIRDVWYGLYGKDYEERSFMTKKSLHEAALNVGRLSIGVAREARLHQAINDRQERRNQLIKELRLQNERDRNDSGSGSRSMEVEDMDCD